MFDIVLYQPEIPPNTGNIIRLCANSGARLHLIKPLGFFLEDKQLRRAGLDYHEFASVRTHEDFAAFVAAVNPPRLFAFTTKATRSYAEARFQPGDALLFGPESRGLPAPVVEGVPPEQRLRIPMLPGSRSINLSNAVALVLYEAWRQNGFEGAL
ncbi:MAG TPA: tRNA (uridine(34)/cytosine(34)/5-carboxymethylaminomethyluridine(34)-2'-O)-methyltransferase TrmL [Opitutaceae bacterium]|nr:tRNA (uridine(34)/cytosine(34)/5-carboxymethylaminomethyluridine(34)-2'-O)-methyltransferase TrmL [Opitutaceae bacterium]